jgi:CspA family cold shock protein
VQWFNAEKGYGFAMVDKGQDVYVHYSAIEAEPRTLTEGQSVDLEVVDGTHGPMAQSIRPL